LEKLCFQIKKKEKEKKGGSMLQAPVVITDARHRHRFPVQDFSFVITCMRVPNNKK
jgi:hypothetical protein